MNKIKKILVTGGTGFIGSHVIDKLIKMKYEVVMSVRNSSQQIPNSDKIHLFKCDIKDREGVLDAVSHCDAVINLAGVLGTSVTESDTNESIEVNVKGALNVFNGCKLYDVPCVHVTVGNPFWLNNYSTSKYASERLAIMYNNDLKTRISVIRAFNVYGPHQRDKPVKKAIPNFILNALQNKPISIYGDGSQKMDFIFVDDVVEILIRSLFKEHDSYKNAFEAGTGNAISVNQVVDIIKNQTNSSSKVEHLPMRKGEPETSIIEANLSTLKPLDYIPKVSFEEGISKTIPYYKNSIK